MTKRIGHIILKDALFILGTIVLVIVISLLFRGTVKGMTKDMTDESIEKYYRNLEKEYVSEVKKELAAAGYANAGVMLTKVISEDGFREYTLTVNHRKFANEADAEASIASVINGIILPVENMGISIMTTY